MCLRVQWSRSGPPPPVCLLWWRKWRWLSHSLDDSIMKCLMIRVTCARVRVDSGLWHCEDWRYSKYIHVFCWLLVSEFPNKKKIQIDTQIIFYRIYNFILTDKHAWCWRRTASFGDRWRRYQCRRPRNSSTPSAPDLLSYDWSCYMTSLVVMPSILKLLIMIMEWKHLYMYVRVFDFSYKLIYQPITQLYRESDEWP